MLAVVALDPGSTLAVGNLLFFFFSLVPFVFLFLFFVFCFFFGKTYFHFLTNLNYTGRIIAGSLSAFISKIQ